MATTRRRVIKGLKTVDMPVPKRARFLLTHAKLHSYDYHPAWDNALRGLETDYWQRQLDRFERILIKKGIQP